MGMSNDKEVQKKVRKLLDELRASIGVEKEERRKGRV